MWTSSCFDWPSELANPYNYASILEPFFFILLPLAAIKEYGDSRKDSEPAVEHRLNRVFKPIYTFVVTFCSVGGYMLAVWMRRILDAGIIGNDNEDPYKVIAAMLFVIATVIVTFSLSIILVVSFNQKSAETREFKEAKSAAERSNAAKSEFLANMSHEIRTPINAVLGMNEMIMRESLKARDMLPEERELIRSVFADICNYSGNIESAGNNLLSIINDILDFSKIEAGKMELVDGEYKFSSVLNDVSNMISFKAKDKELDFRVDVDDTMPDGLYGDEVRVRQVITNLLNNAVKYTNQGGILLTVRRGEHVSDPAAEQTHSTEHTHSKDHTASAENGDRKITDIIVTVKDSGIGIRQEDIDKLFTKFERVDMEKNSTVEGTGLGLAITHSILDMMGGSISVESEYGRGSVFTAVIPQAVVSDDPIGDFKAKYEKSISSMKVKEESFHAPNATILVVDDTKMNLLVVKGLLKNTEMLIDTASSGRESVEMAKKKRYDLVLMDQRMPEMNGVTAMQLIKMDTASLNVHTPFICLTADAVTGARERYLAEGFDDYLTKPIEGRLLEEMIRKYLPKDLISPDNGEVTAAAAATPSLEWNEDDPAYADLIDSGKGLLYSGGSEDFYKEILLEYVRDSASRTELLNGFKASGDLENYSIVVHALKSTSKMIGAMELSGIAASLEEASKNGDIAVVNERHDPMMTLYTKVIYALKARLGITDDAIEPVDDGSVMEFAPVGPEE